MRVSFRGFSGILFSMDANVERLYTALGETMEEIVSYDIDLKLDSGERAEFRAISPKEITINHI